MTSLIIQTAYLGDVALTVPLIDAVAAVERTRVDVVTTPAAAPLVETLPSVESVIIYDKRGRGAGLTGLGRIITRLHRRHYSCAFLPHQSWRTALIARLAGIPRRVGFASSPARRLYSHAVAWPADRYESDRMLSLAGATPGSFRAHLELTDDDRDRAARWLRRHGIGEAPFVAMAPGSVWATKRYASYFEVAVMVADTLPVVLVGGAAERSLVKRWGHPRVYSAVGELPLRVSASLIERAALLVANDSAPLHLANAVGTPVLAIYGPTAPEFGYGPRGPRDRTIALQDLACRPCSRHGHSKCPLDHHRCMRDLSPASVLRVIEEMYAIRHGG